MKTVDSSSHYSLSCLSTLMQQSFQDFLIKIPTNPTQSPLSEEIVDERTSKANDKF
jgi:hypothetical protein